MKIQSTQFFVCPISCAAYTTEVESSPFFWGIGFKKRVHDQSTANKINRLGSFPAYVPSPFYAPTNASKRCAPSDPDGDLPGSRMCR